MPDDSPKTGQHGRFATTSWSVVLRAGIRDAGGKLAFQDLCVAYWYPLFVYARRKGQSAQDAEDAVQTFLGNLFEAGTVERADPERGRFRSFLITAFDQYLAQQYRHNSAQKRRPNGKLFSIDAVSGDERYSREPVDLETAELQFERAWAMTVLDRALTRLQAEWVASGKGDKFEALKSSLTSHQSESGREIAKKLGMSEGAVRVALHRLKSQLGEILREEVALTVEHEADVDQELKLLVASLAAA